MSRIDVDVLRLSQGVVALLTGLAFVADLPWLVGATCVLLAASWSMGPQRTPLAHLYTGIIRPRLRRPVEVEDARAPRFAQLLGAAVLAVATLAFLAGLPTLGWALSLLVTALATLAAATRLCLGCALYRRFAGR